MLTGEPWSSVIRRWASLARLGACDWSWPTSPMKSGRTSSTMPASASRIATKISTMARIRGRPSSVSRWMAGWIRNAIAAPSTKAPSRSRMRYRTSTATRAEPSPNASWRYRRRRRGSSDQATATAVGRGSGSVDSGSCEEPAGRTLRKVRSSMNEASQGASRLTPGRNSAGLLGRRVRSGGPKYGFLVLQAVQGVDGPAAGSEGDQADSEHAVSHKRPVLSERVGDEATNGNAGNACGLDKAEAGRHHAAPVRRIGGLNQGCLVRDPVDSVAQGGDKES